MPETERRVSSFHYFLNVSLWYCPVRIVWLLPDRAITLDVFQQDCSRTCESASTVCAYLTLFADVFSVRLADDTIAV